MQEVQTLANKLELLLKKYATLQTENARLEHKLGEQSHAVETLNKKISVLENNITDAHAGQAAMTAEDKNGMRRQLDMAIGEIDKILKTLND